MDSKIRVRYAPSPTGFLHIGGARSALFNYLFCKKLGGKFIFRSEDTDIVRNVEGGEESQYQDLLWLGIIPDESPFNPNPKYGPYRQTERLDTYLKYAHQLVEQGAAYYCYCTEEELETRKQSQLDSGIKATKYDRKCLNLSPEEIEKYRKEGRKPCIRIKLPDDKTYSFNDLVRGEVKISSEDLGGDFVIVKSNGIPTYNFAVVIDDHLMEITHVLRGEEHLSNTPKQLAIYEALGWDAPKFGHMTIIVNKDGKKLSKRDLNVLQFMSQYRNLGYLAPAIVNYLLLLGWTPKDNREIFTLEEACQIFDPTRLSVSPSTFDEEKMKWTNAQYIKNLDEAQYIEFIKPFVTKYQSENYSIEKLLSLAKLFQTEISYGQEVQPLIEGILTIKYQFDQEQLEVLNAPSTEAVIKAFLEKLPAIIDFSKENVKEVFKGLQKELGVGGKFLYMPIRLLLTGNSHGLELFHILDFLGKTEIENRLNYYFRSK